MRNRDTVNPNSDVAQPLAALHELVVAHFADTKAFVAACLALGCEVLDVDTGLVSTGAPENPRVLYAHTDRVDLRPGDEMPSGATVRVPIAVNGNCLGMLHFGDGACHAEVSAAQRQLLTTMAALLGRFLEREQHDAQRLRLRARLDTRLQLLESSFQYALVGSAIEDVTTQRIVDVNPALCQQFGYSREQLIGMKFADLSHPEDRDATAELIAQLISGCRASGHLEKRYRHRDGHIIDAYVGVTLVRDVADVPRHLIVQVLNVTDLKAATDQLQASNRELERLALTDGLTGLWNRRYFDRVLAHEWVRSKRYRVPMSLVLLDVDHFKRLNDRFGHDVGDRVLATLGRLLSEQIRSADVIARYGGEEFAMILPETGEQAAHMLAERCRQAVAKYPWAHRPVTVSVGVASLEPGTATTASELVRRADQALYTAKAHGRNTTMRMQTYRC